MWKEKINIIRDCFKAIFSRKYYYFLIYSLFLVSCSNDKDRIKKYLENDYYLSAPLDLETISGHNRIKLLWDVSADSNEIIAFSRVYWNDGNDSMDVPVNVDNNSKNVFIIINDLKEKSYTFEIVNYNKEGLNSPPKEVKGNALGSSYIHALENRVIVSSFMDEDNASILWDNPPNKDAIYTELSFKDGSNHTHTVKVLPSDSLVHLAGFSSNTKFKYRTVFAPGGSNAIDTFYVDYKIDSIGTGKPVVEMGDNDKDEDFNLALDINGATVVNYTPVGGDDEFSDPQKILNGNENGNGYWSTMKGTSRQIIIDLGKYVNMNYIRIKWSSGQRTVNPLEILVAPEGGSPWNKVKSLKYSDEPQGRNVLKEVQLDSPVQGRYIQFKLNFSEGNKNKTVRIRAISVYYR